MRFAAILTAFCLFTGCDGGSANGTVSGTITLDGQPVDGGLIRFIPIDGNSQPDDSPITNGAYSVTMTVGEKRVEIFWLKSSGGVQDTSTQGTVKSVQMIPTRYNTESTLTYTIVKGKQTKDFSLQSKP